MNICKSEIHVCLIYILLHCSVEAAYAAFAQARPPGIIKGQYIEELFARYGSREEAPPAPPLPTWHTESDDSLGKLPYKMLNFKGCFHKLLF